MALPSNFPIIPPVAPVIAGIMIGLAPTDATFEMEIQRAPDSSGVPGTPVTIAQVAPANPSQGTLYMDRLPVTGTLYYYRFRHVRTGWTAGSWGPYSRAATAQFMDGSNLPPAHPFPFAPGPDSPDGTVSDETIGADGIIVLGPDGRDDVSFNGDAEGGLAYWEGIDNPGALSLPIPVKASVNFGLETATPFSGTASFKFTAVTTGAVQQTVRPTNANAESSGPLLFRIKNGDLFGVSAALKASSASTIVNVWFRLYEDQGILEESTQLIAQFQGVGTSWVEFTSSQVASVISLGQKYGSIMVTTNSTDGRTVYFDQLRVTRLRSSADLGGTIAPPTIDGFYQDNVAASQTNVELIRAVGRWRATQAGSITGVVATMTEARTAGTLTVTVFKNTGLAGAAGSSVGLTAVIDGTNTSRKATTQAKDTDTFAAGDELYLVVTTDSGWLPVTSDLIAALEVEV